MKNQGHSVPETSKLAHQKAIADKVVQRHELSIVTFLFANQDFAHSARKIAKGISLTDVQVSRRIGKIVRSGKAFIAGIKKESGRKVQQYQYNASGILRPEKPSRFELLRSIMKEYIPDWEYQNIMREFSEKSK